MTFQAQIDLGTYAADKAAGVCRIVKVNGDCLFVSKVHDRAGNPTSTTTPIQRQTIVDLIANTKDDLAKRQSVLDSLEAALVDLDASKDMLDA